MNSPSIISKFLLLYLKVSGYKHKLNHSYWLNNKSVSSPSKYFKNKFQLSDFDKGDHKTWSISAENSNGKKVILYLHGGGYTRGLDKVHWKFIEKLISRTGFTFCVPDFPLSPKHTATTVFDFLIPVYKKVLADYGPENIILMGDSSGGGMALGLTQLLIQKKIDRPSQLILLSPWLDLTLSNPNIEEIEDADPLLDRKLLQKLGEYYTGELDNTNFMVSPIYGDIKRIPPTTLFIGSEELFLSDCRKLKIRAESEPIIFNYREFKGLVHNWMFRRIPEASMALDMIATQVKLRPDDMEDPVNAGGNFWS